MRIVLVVIMTGMLAMSAVAGPTTGPRGRGLSGPAAPITVERAAGALLLTASLFRTTFAPGEPVGITLAARNSGTAALGITFTSGQRYDVIVRRARGDEVWRWSHDKAFIQVIQSISLAAHDSMTFQEAWDQRDLQGRRVDPGAYEVVAVFLGQTAGGQGRVTLPPLPFTITK